MVETSQKLAHKNKFNILKHNLSSTTFDEMNSEIFQIINKNVESYIETRIQRGTKGMERSV